MRWECASKWYSEPVALFQKPRRVYLSRLPLVGVSGYITMPFKLQGMTWKTSNPISLRRRRHLNGQITIRTSRGIIRGDEDHRPNVLGSSSNYTPFNESPNMNKPFIFNANITNANIRKRNIATIDCNESPNSHSHSYRGFQVTDSRVIEVQLYFYLK